MQENKVKQYLMANSQYLSLKAIANEAGVDRHNLFKFLNPEKYPNYHTLPADYVDRLAPIVKKLQTPGKAPRRKSQTAKA